MYIVWTLTFYNPKRDLLAVLQRVNLNLGHMRTKKMWFIQDYRVAWKIV